MNQNAIKKVVNVFEHINPPWGVNGTKFSAHFKGIIGRGQTPNQAIVHLISLVTQIKELKEDFDYAISKAGQ